MTPSVDSDTIRAERRRLVEDMTVRMGEGLVPLRMDPPLPNDGLRSIAFGEGLDELTVQSLRQHPTGVHGSRGPEGDQAVLRAAARRARAMDEPIS